MDTLKFIKTESALRMYDYYAPKRRELWDAVECNDDVYKAEKAEADAERKVQMAFFEDTKAFNTLNSCLRLEISFMRRVCANNKVRINESLKPAINGRLPIRYAVIKLGYSLFGAGRLRQEAINNAEACSPGVSSKIVEDAGDHLADGEIFVASIENDFFDDYFNGYNCFEKIGENWYFTTDKQERTA